LIVFAGQPLRERKVARRVREPYYDPLMTEDPHAVAIRAFARLAIAAGAEPRRVQAQLGPHATCHTSAARRRSISQLIADAQTASAALGLTAPFPSAARDVTVKEFFADKEIRNQFADTMIECGAAIRDMSKARPALRRSQNREQNYDVLAEFENLVAELLASAHAIDRQVSRIANGAANAQLQAQGLSDTAIHDYQLTVRRAHHVAQRFRWRAVPGTTSATRTRNAFLQTTRFNRDRALRNSDAVRDWATHISEQG
jgi:hypothetical protein